MVTIMMVVGDDGSDGDNGGNDSHSDGDGGGGGWVMVCDSGDSGG